MELARVDASCRSCGLRSPAAIDAYNVLDPTCPNDFPWVRTIPQKPHWAMDSFPHSPRLAVSKLAQARMIHLDLSGNGQRNQRIRASSPWLGDPRYGTAFGNALHWDLYAPTNLPL